MPTTCIRVLLEMNINTKVHKNIPVSSALKRAHTFYMKVTFIPV
jgi:hypothetical protein